MKTNESSYDPWLDNHATIIYIGLGTITKLSKESISHYFDAIRIVTDGYNEDSYFYFKIGNKKDTRLSDESNDQNINTCDQTSSVVQSDNNIASTLKDELLLEGLAVPHNAKITHFIESQLAVLNHDNVKVFVSHCGGNGIHDGLYFGKPILGVPQWTDCYDFAQRLEDSGAGLRVRQTIPFIDPVEFSSKLLGILRDSSFSMNAKKLKNKMRDAGGAQAVVNTINDYLKS